MPGCSLPEFIGKDVALEVAFACGDVDPATLTFMPVGAMTTKSFTGESNTVSAMSDKATGSVVPNFVVSRNVSASGSGLARREDDASSNVVRLVKHWAKPEVGFNNQPVVWVRMTFPHLTFIFYAIISSISHEAPTEEMVTFDVEFQATSSDSGLLVDDTPQPPDSIAVTPTTVSIAVSEDEQLVVAATPPESSAAVTYTSSAPSIATVSSSGLVTGVAVGTATITIRSVGDEAVTDTVAVTVTV